MMAPFALKLVESLSMQSIQESTQRSGATTKELEFETSLGYVLRSASSNVHGALSAVLEGHEVSYIQWVILLTLHELGTATITEMARRFGYNTGTLSRLTDRLARRDLLRRLRTDGDRRVVVLSLTVSGNELVRSSLPRVARAWSGILSRFDDSEVRMLVSFLQRLDGLDIDSPGRQTDDSYRQPDFLP